MSARLTWRNREIQYYWTKDSHAISSKFCIIRMYAILLCVSICAYPQINDIFPFGIRHSLVLHVVLLRLRTTYALFFRARVLFRLSGCSLRMRTANISGYESQTDIIISYGMYFKPTSNQIKVPERWIISTCLYYMDFYGIFITS